MIQTTLRNLRELTSEEWERDYGDPGQFLPMLRCMDAEELVVVNAQATDGYYDITLPSGIKIEAISWYHLDGFTKDGIEGLGG